MEASDVALLISVANTALVGVGALLLWDQIRREHNWNRRRAAHDLLFAATADLRRLRNELGPKIDIWDEEQTYRTVAGSLTPEDHATLDAILNYCENICLAIHNGIVDEKLIFDTLASVILAYRRWADPYIREQRAMNGMFWIGIEPFVDSWKAKQQQRVLRAVGPRRTPA